MINVLSALISTVVCFNLIAPGFCMDNEGIFEGSGSQLKTKTPKFRPGEESFIMAMNIFRSHGETEEYIQALTAAAWCEHREAIARLTMIGRWSKGGPCKPPPRDPKKEY